jgi:type VI secretion system secreted protein VgrG
VKEEREVTRTNRLLLVKKDQDIVVRGDRRERVEYDKHSRVVGDRVERVKKNHSLTVLEEKHEMVGETFARQTGKEHHIVAGVEFIGEGGNDVTIKGPGGFLRIDATGVIIKGRLVKINKGNTGPGHGHGTNTQDPKEAKEALIPVGSMWKTGPAQDQAGTRALLEELAALDMKKDDKLGPTAIALLKLSTSHDVSTARNGAIFWSGGASFAGKAADQLAAMRNAAGRPSTRLEGTVGGGVLAQIAGGIGADEKAGKEGAPWSEQQPAWRLISRRYAEGASGEVTAVVGNVPVGENAILREEVKLLRANPNVTAIHFVAIQKDEHGNALKDELGNYMLTPVSAKEVLAMPPREGTS